MSLDHLFHSQTSWLSFTIVSPSPLLILNVFFQLHICPNLLLSENMKFFFLPDCFPRKASFPHVLLQLWQSESFFVSFFYIVWDFSFYLLLLLKKTTNAFSLYSLYVSPSLLSWEVQTCKNFATNLKMVKQSNQISFYYCILYISSSLLFYKSASSK